MQGPLISELLQSAPLIKVLVTSRIVLHLTQQNTNSSCHPWLSMISLRVQRKGRLWATQSCPRHLPLCACS